MSPPFLLVVAAGDTVADAAVGARALQPREGAGTGGVDPHVEASVDPLLDSPHNRDHQGSSRAAARGQGRKARGRGAIIQQ